MSSDSDFAKICGICGDKAIAKNFGAVSCESCKAFFRRNASKINVYKCYFDNKCKIDAITRKFCRKCRLRKCFEVGMKQEWILSDEQKQIRRKKIEEKKQVRKNSIHGSVASDSVTSDSATGSPPETHELDSGDLFFDNISDEEIVTNIMQIEKYIDSEDKSDEISDDVYQKAVELEFAVLPFARPMPSNNNIFNEMECNRLIELFNALNIMRSYETKTPEVNKIDHTNPSVMCSLMSTRLENDIKNLVTVSKSLDSFNNLCESDQISLLKHSSPEVFSLRSVLNYDFVNNNWCFNLNDRQTVVVSLEMFKNPKSNMMYDNYLNYLTKMGKEWDSDSIIVDLLTAVILFNPDRPRVIHRDMIKLQQQIYMYLLQRYLSLKYRTECESKEKFLRLLNILQDLNVLGKAHAKCKKEKDPELFGPLVREVLDMDSV